MGLDIRFIVTLLFEAPRGMPRICRSLWQQRLQGAPRRLPDGVRLPAELTTSKDHFSLSRDAFALD